MIMEIGEYIPNNLGIDGEGRLVNAAADYAHTPLIIYFYPKDNTPGCTAEACSLRDGYARLRQMGYEIIGISRDTPESHKRFAAKHSLPFTLLTDVTGEVCNDFGVWQLKKMAGREYMGIKRTTFITDSDHKLTHIIEKVNTKDAASQILALLNA
ncbi:MAG: peroxiredoxin [Muribaculaceae bacterium]|nr:peroxiredoxin [Bacteroidales bacterium]MDY4811270.1 peroxiredoxin [Muribaculaceae bacterium]